eukprot:TRINITY_DN39125_c0_g1_i1.p1 TRINITY_DN39125_c0_g1~~TRINITY_DN39125_c0_g1_i1.p1  ORF type:complete len:838 (+),score=220.36 TRINITY_DN39125_c0_g1_i1:63-2576(+)
MLGSPMSPGSPSHAARVSMARSASTEDVEDGGLITHVTVTRTSGARVQPVQVRRVRSLLTTDLEDGAQITMAPSLRAPVPGNNVYEELADLQHLDLEAKQQKEAIVRQHLSELGESVSNIHNNVDEFRRQMEEALREVRKQVNDLSAQTRVEQKSIADRFTKELGNIREEMDKQRKERMDANDKVRDEARALIQPLKQQIDGMTDKRAEDVQNMRKLQDAVMSLQSTVTSLQDALNKEVRERKLAEAPLLDLLRDHRESHVRELREHAANHSAQLDKVKDALDKQKSAHEPAFQELRGEMQIMKKDFKPHAAQVPQLERKIKDMEDALHPRLDEHKKALEKLHNDVAAFPVMLKDRLDTESKNRNMIIEDMEQSVSRLQKELRNASNGHNDAIRDVKDALDRHKADVEPALEEVRNHVATVARELKPNIDKVPALHSKVQDLESAVLSRLEDHSKTLASANRDIVDLRNTMQPKLTECQENLRKESAARKVMEDSLHPQLKEHKKTLDRLADDVSKWPSKYDIHLDESGPLRTAIRDETSRMIVNLRTEMRNDGHGDAIQDIREHHEKTQHHGPAIEQLRDHVEQLQRDFAPHVARAPELHTKLRSLEEAVHPQLQEHRRLLDRVVGEHRDASSKLERRMNDLGDHLQREASHRHSMLEDHEQQLANVKAKLRKDLGEAAEAQRRCNEEFTEQLRGDIEKRVALHDDHLRALREQVQGDKKGTEARLDTLHKALSDIERKAQSGDGDATSRRTLLRLEELQQQLQDMQRNVERSLQQERQTREEVQEELEESLAALESLFHNVGERFANNHLRRCAATTSSYRFTSPFEDASVEVVA